MRCEAENCADFFKMTLGERYHANFLSQGFSHCTGSYGPNSMDSSPTFSLTLGNKESRINQATAANIAYETFSAILQLSGQANVMSKNMDITLDIIRYNAKSAETKINTQIEELRSVYSIDGMPQIKENHNAILQNLNSKSGLVNQFNTAAKLLAVKSEIAIFNPPILSNIPRYIADPVENEKSKWIELAGKLPENSQHKNLNSLPFHTLKKIYQKNPLLGSKILTDLKYARYMEMGLTKKSDLPLLNQVQNYESKTNFYNGKYDYFKKSLGKNDPFYKEKKLAMTTSYELRKIADDKVTQGDFDKANEGMDIALLSLDLATAMPGLATGRGLYEFLSGKSLLTNRELSNFERGASLSIALIDLMPAAWIANGVKGAWLVGELGSRLVARGLIKAGFEDALNIGVRNVQLITEAFQRLLASGAAKLETIKKIIDNKLFFKNLDKEGYLASKFEKNIIEFEQGLSSTASSKLEEHYLANKIAYQREGTVLTTGDAVNTGLKERYPLPPFTPEETVLKNTTIEGERFYRFSGPKSEKVGNFMAREKDIVDLDFKQIQEKFALEHEPTGMVIVDPDIGVPFFEGPAASNFGQPGGGWQVYINGEVKKYWFKDLP